MCKVKTFSCYTNTRVCFIDTFWNGKPYFAQFIVEYVDDWTNREWSIGKRDILMLYSPVTGRKLPNLWAFLRRFGLLEQLKDYHS